MKRTVFIAATLLLVGGISRPAMAERAQGPTAGLNPSQIEQLTGARGQMNEKENVFKVSVPRTDLSVTVAGTRLTPPMGLTSWVAFTPAGPSTMAMGDLVLTEDQVNPVMSAALDNGLEVTALHNHFLGESPRVMFMHISGMGDQAQLASAVGRVLSAMKQTRGQAKEAVPRADLDPSRTSLNPQRIDAILGQKGELKDGVYKVTLGRTTRMHGQEVGNAMGVNTWAAFIGSDDQAVVDGDFAVLGTELQGVLKALRHAGINVVAIHNHMVGEEPRIVFLHFWGVGATDELARGLKAAIEVTSH